MWLLPKIKNTDMEDGFHISIFLRYLLVWVHIHFYKHFLPFNSLAIKNRLKNIKAQLQLNDFYLYL